MAWYEVMTVNNKENMSAV